MSEYTRRYVIIGAGAVGGTIAARLSAAGVEVALVARGDHAEAIERHDLRLRTPAGEVVGRPTVWRTPSDAQLTERDVIVLAVKTQHAHEALAPWITLPLHDGRPAGTVLPVLVAMNGVAGERIALRYARRVYGICVWTPATYTEPGLVSSYFTPTSGVFHVGRVPAERSDEYDHALLSALSAEWSAAGLSMPVQDDVMAWKWRKLLNNVGNAFDALFGDVTDASARAVADELRGRARTEAEQVIAAAGITLVDHAIERRARAEGPGFGDIPGAPYEGSSSRQSLVRGTGSIESAWLNGEIAMLAHTHGLDAPVNEGIVGISVRAAAQGAQPGEWTPQRVSQELGLD